VRNKVVWAKTNPIPSSVTDRLSLTYEPVYLLVRSRRYYFDLDSIREPHRSPNAKRKPSPSELPASWAGPLASPRDGLRRVRAADHIGVGAGEDDLRAAGKASKYCTPGGRPT
jgi:site-specific DNA-methyltransferase (adenine-specific)